MTLEAALHYCDLGFSVIPIHGIVKGKCTCGNAKCKKPGKHPRVKWRDKSTKRPSTDDIKNWWKKFPNCNVGIITGEISGIAVIDVDGQEGLESLKALGLPIKELPETPTVKTGGGGYHLIYELPKNLNIKTRSGILNKVDIRAEGGLIVAPPSLHASGKNYEWAKDRGIDDVHVNRFDFSQLKQTKERPELRKKKKPTRAWFALALEGTGKGDRNDTAARLAGRYFSLGLSEDEVIFLLDSWNRKNQPPMDNKELATTIDSIKHKEYGDDMTEEDSMSIISGILKLELTSVKRITGDDPQYILRFQEGEATVSTGQLLSPKGLQQAVAEATKIIIGKLSTKTNPTHDKLAQLIMSVAKEQDAGIEATKVGEVLSMLDDYITAARDVIDLDENPDEEIPYSGAFRKEGRYWINVDDLINRTARKLAIKTNRQSLAQNLRAIGVIRKEFRISEDSPDTRNVWGVDLNKLKSLRKKG